MLIDATHAEETRVVVVDGTRVEEFDFETAARRQLAGNIYLAKVTRVEPSLQAAFVDYGGNRHGFLAFAEIHPDYYQIPVADRQALLAEERAFARSMDEDEGRDRSRRRPGEDGGAGTDEGDRRQGSRGPRTAAAASGEAAASGSIPGMDVVDLGEEAEAGTVAEPLPGAEDEPRERPYAAVDHAAEIDDEIESIAEEDVSEEIAQPRKPRPRRYKIQEVIKVRQIMLVQVVKEERGNKGAALTTYLSLAGRYCVLMPNTARGGGISRKITNAVDRKKLKEIAAELEVPEGAGLIIRTAGAKRTKAEIKRDYEYLQRLWDQIRELTLRSIAPAPIYEEGDLIKRSIRDLYSRDIEEVLVEGEAGYRVAKDFMKMIMPSHARNVQLYTEPMPLFARYQVESFLAGMFNPVVQLKSGGYIVIGITEALVSIDVNSGRATKEGSIEETALKTNLEAAEEIARQLRLRDLAGLIVIDFIDMEDRKNNAAVEKRLKDKLKTDRARIQVGRISGFGLLEMSRQRLRPGMLEATTRPCPHCHGTGLIRSDDSLALSVLRQIEEEGTRKRSKEVLLKAPVGIVNFLINHKREHIAGIEARYGMAVRLEADPSLISPNFTLEKFKTATRLVVEAPAVPAPSSSVVSLDSSSMPEPVEELEDELDPEAEDEAADAPRSAEAGEPRREGGEADGGKRRRRRRRRRRGGGYGEAAGEVRGEDEALAWDDGAGGDAGAEGAEAEGAEAYVAEAYVAEAAAAEAGVAEAGVAEAEARGAVPAAAGAPAPEAEPAAAAGAPPVEAEAPAAEAAGDATAEQTAPKKRTRAPRKPSTRTRKAAAGDDAAGASALAASTVDGPAAPAREAPEAATAVQQAPASAGPAPQPEPVPATAAAPQPMAAPAPLPEMAVAGSPAAPPGPAPASDLPPVGAADGAADGAAAGAAAGPPPEVQAKPRRRGWWSSR